MSTHNKLPFSNQFERGHSFNWAGEWTAGKYYYNDEYVTDFVTYHNVVLECRISHLATEDLEPQLIYKDNELIGIDSQYWGYVIGVPSEFNLATKEDIDNLNYDE